MKLSFDEELCHVKVREDYCGLTFGEDKIRVEIYFLDGPFKGAIVEAEVDKDDIQDEYIDEE